MCPSLVCYPEFVESNQTPPERNGMAVGSTEASSPPQLKQFDAISSECNAHLLSADQEKQNNASRKSVVDCGSSEFPQPHRTGSTTTVALCSSSTSANQALWTSQQQQQQHPRLPFDSYSADSSPQLSPRNRKRRNVQSAPKECRQISIENTGNCLHLNQYRLMDPIGQGSYSIVKLAYNEEDDTCYAMKILSKRRLMRKAGFLGRLPPPKHGQKGNAPHPLDNIYREVAVLKKLNHPNVVKLVEVLDDPTEDHLYMVFEWIERGHVMDVPTSSPLSLDKAWRYFRDIVLGIEYLHLQHIVHRDIKPANLLLSKDDHILIADFGVCSEFNGSDAFLTSTAGTPAFAAPETLTSGMAAISGRHSAGLFAGKATDVWSMGITLYAFLFGDVPFGGDNIIALYQSICNEPVKFPDTKLDEQFDPAGVRALIERMLTKDPKHRITIAEIKRHEWVTRCGTALLSSDPTMCQQVEITEEDMASAVTSIPKLGTLILIKHMLKKHSFQNPFSRKRTPHTSIDDHPDGSTSRCVSTTTAAPLLMHAHSAPSSYVWTPASGEHEICENSPSDLVDELPQTDAELPQHV